MPDLRPKYLRAIEPCTCSDSVLQAPFDNIASRVRLNRLQDDLQAAQSAVHISNFLALPPRIRRRIYCLAGLVHGESIFIARPQHATISPSDANLQTTLNLLLTCKPVHEEIAAIVYSENKFVSIPKNPTDIGVLRKFSPRAVSHLRDLAVHLNTTSCARYPHFEPCCRDSLQDTSRLEYHDEPVKQVDADWRAFFSEWDRTMKHFLAYVTPDQLTLSLVCDVEDLTAACLALEPLRKISNLTDCSIRLGSHRDTRLQGLAREAALVAVGKSPRRTDHPFRYLDLAPETRLKILEYTDLVTPLNEVNWNPQGGYYVEYWLDNCHVPGGCALDFHYACQFRKCSTHSRQGCFCMRFHSAYTRNCRCWAPPQPLFLVCHNMREEAEAVFFRCNRFIVKPTGGCFEPPKSNPARLEASRFLTTVVRPSALHHLRDLEIIIPPFEPDYFPDGGEAHLDWKGVISRLKSELCLPKLTLRVYLSDYSFHGTKVTAYRAQMTHDQALDVVRTCLRLLTPLIEYRTELKRLFLHLACPLNWTKCYRQREYAAPGYLERRNKFLGDLVGRTIMSQEFERLNEGKEDKPESQWLRKEVYYSEGPGPGNPLLYYG
jgi:hypothetical protein